VVVNNGAKLKAFTPRRYIYETCIGPLDRKQVVVMSCENARCLNPAHMVTVFRGGQMRRIPVTTDIEFNPDGLRALREQWGMTQATLAELCGVVPDMVRRWERGQCPSGTLLLRIIAALSRNPHAHFRTDQVLQRLMRKTQMATEDKHA
jgi:DNA-binding transcriptional regulator YiaG